MINFILPKFQFKVEKWKWNKEYRVYVSTLGNFKNEYKKNIALKINSNGYVMIKTPYGLKSAHRLVMLTFKPIPNAEDLTIDHLNHNKRDNSLNNLEWVTLKENQTRAMNDFVIAPQPVISSLNIVLKSGNAIFTSYTEAAQFCQTMYHMMDVPIETIEKRIYNAMANNKMYCGRKWKEILK